MAEAGKEQVGIGLFNGDVSQWPLQRYGRFMPLGIGEPGLEAGMASAPTWKVFNSSEESGHLVLTVVISGHFFISQGQTLLEGFSLIGSKNWLKIVRRMDCLLFGTTIKDCSRMFRVQFRGKSRQQALDCCSSCVQSLARYVPVQMPDGRGQETQLHMQGGSEKGCVPGTPLQRKLTWEPEQQLCAPADTGAPGGRTSVTQLAQALLAPEELPLVYQRAVWDAEELGPFLRCCLLDRHFPAFVEDVEKELGKLTGLRN
ncbi:meiotic recombination protein REC114 [Saccopteryx bilineata]|uniref:meiotic recombination protein REC114 n=1 Tax=Saccopteryx bilineata TaxID=59482 RepID=UPI0033904800